jgi:hypothetical protein
MAPAAEITRFIGSVVLVTFEDIDMGTPRDAPTNMNKKNST